jgi:L-threonylcarbamoyladenylate synthase
MPGGSAGGADLVTTDIERALRALRRGGMVAIPTETVYGLAADASDPAAVARIYATKGRPVGHPLIVHVASFEAAEPLAARFPPAAARLAEVAWPGPLTVIVPRSAAVSDAVTGGRDTVGLRVPAHRMTLELLERFGGGLAAPSANRFGSVSATTAADVLEELGDRLDPGRDLILDGGPCPVGVESTIVDCVADPPQILRAGAITVAEISALLGAVGETSGPSRASGMLVSHYAPRATVTLTDDRAEADRLHSSRPGSEILDLTDDLVEYARQLYARLRDADRRGVAEVIAVVPPLAGLGHAIADRLTKAAAPRPD